MFQQSLFILLAVILCIASLLSLQGLYMLTTIFSHPNCYIIQ